MKANEFFSKNGTILPIAEATVSLMSIEYAYGFGVYETLRSIKGRCVFLEEHVERLVKSAEIIGLEHDFDADIFSRAIIELVAQDPDSTYNVKVMLIGAARKEDATLYVFCSNPLFPDKKLYRDGVTVGVSHYERVFPHAKSLNMLQSYLAYRDAKRTGCYDALVVNREGNITEGTRTNFFTIKDKVIFSPPEEDILLGVTRTKVLDVARRLGFEIVSHGIPLSSVGKYDGAFLTSTSTKIVPIKRIDAFEYANVPETTRTLMNEFDRYFDAL
jgi:branched-chain amino acid aminotransferase